MSKDQNDNRNQPSDSVSKEKTNQDFNKQKPNPSTTNQTHQIGEDDERENNSRKVTAENSHKSTGNQTTETSHNTHSTDNHKTEKHDSDKGKM
jgi:hypothetical protein